MPQTSTAIGKTCKTQGAKVAGVVACVPRRSVDNLYFSDQFGAAAVADVTKLIGVQSRRWVESFVTAADLCFDAAEKLLVDLEWDRESVDALLFVSQTPDYRLPATACALHGRLGLNPQTIAFDVNLGCSGYPYALWLAMTMIQSGAAQRVLLAVGDTISRVVDPQDRATAMLFGDAGTVTAVEAADTAGEDSIASFVLGTDGRGSSKLIIPRGGFKTHQFAPGDPAEGRNPDCLYMDGGEIFNFTLSSVPTLVSKALEYDGQQPDGYMAFLFHQANLFMLKHLVKKSKLPVEKVPMNIDRYGNTSCASIPLLMCTDLRDQLQLAGGRLAMFGFGVGFSWGAACMNVGPLRVVELIEL